jgi:uncharacterized membrane protein
MILMLDRQERPWLKPAGIAALFFLLYIGVIRLIQLHCFSYFDLGIYSEALARIKLSDLNPFIPGRNIRIFNDHFDPILVPFAVFTRILPAPYLGVTVETIGILLCWLPISRLRNRGLLNASQAIFTYAFLILNQAMVGAVTWPFHPTTWGVLPLVYVFSAYLLEDWKLLWIAFVALCGCREEFPLLGFSIAFVMLLDKKYRQAIVFFSTALLFSLFLFVLRPKLMGSTSGYAGGLLTSFIHAPLAPIEDLLRFSSIRNWLERLIALFLVLSIPAIRANARSTLRILLIAAPILGIRYASSKWGAHYGSAAIICLFFAFFMSYRASFVASWRTKLSWIFLIAFFLSPTIKNLWDGWSTGSTHFAYKQCPSDSGRLFAIEKAQNWISDSPYQKILLQNNLAPTLLLKTSQKDLFILAGPQTEHSGPFEVVLVEKPPRGDTWGVGPERLTDLIRTWKSIPGIKIIQDDEFVFMAVGLITSER